jgi:LPS-assembly lipoprotein
MQGRDIAAFGRIARLAATLASAAMVAGCFQPLYSAHPAVGGATVHEALSSVSVQQIDAVPNTPEAYLAVQIRNNLLFDFNGGANPLPPTHRLIIKITGTRNIIAIDQNTALPNLERYTLSATYTMTEIATSKIVVTGSAMTNVSYDTVGNQRFARISAMQDAQRRAAKVISDNIRTRLASYFVAGT